MADYMISSGNLHNVDELKHWKYVKKVRGANGKWRYVYDETKVNDMKKQRDEAAAKGSQLAVEAKNAYSDLTRDDYRNNQAKVNEAKIKNNALSKEASEHSKKASELGGEITKAEYEKIMAKGLNFINKLFG